MNLASLLPDSITWVRIGLTIAVLVVGWIISRLARRAVAGVLKRMRGITPTMVTIIARLTGYTIILVAAGIALALLGADIQPLLAVVIVIGVVLVLVLRGASENFAAGVLIQSRRTLDVGDEVQIDSPSGPVIGRVLELNARAVVVLSRDGRTLHVPNAKILSDSIVNHSRHGARRSGIQIRIQLSHEFLEAMVRSIEETIDEAPGVVPTTPTRVLVVAMSPNKVTLEAQFWHRPEEDVPVSSAVVKTVSSALKSQGYMAVVTSDPGEPPLVPPEPI